VPPCQPGGREKTKKEEFTSKNKFTSHVPPYQIIAYTHLRIFLKRKIKIKYLEITQLKIAFFYM
jgi:hypothetical protein